MSGQPGNQNVKLRVMLVHGSQDINDDDDARDDIELIVAALHEKSIEFTRQPDDEPEPDFLHRCLPHHDVALIYVKSDYTQRYQGVALTSNDTCKVMGVFPCHVDSESDAITFAESVIKKISLPDFLWRHALCLRDAKGELYPDLKQRVFQNVTDVQRQKLGVAGKGLAMNYVKATSLLLGKAGQASYNAKYEEVLKTHPKLKKVNRAIIAVPKDCQLKPAFKIHEYGKIFEKLPDGQSMFRVDTTNTHGLKRGWTYDAFFVPGKDDHEYYTRVEFPNIITTLSKMAGKELRDIGIAPLTSEEMRAQRIIFIREMQLLLDMNFRDKYVVVEFTDGDDLSRQVQAVAEACDQEMVDESATDSVRNVSIYCNEDSLDDDDLKDFEKLLTETKDGKPGFTLSEGSTVEVATDMLGQVRSTALEQNTMLFWITGGKLSRKQREIKSHALYTAHNYRCLYAILADDTPLDDDFFKETVSLKYEPETSPRHGKFMEKIRHICSKNLPMTYPLVDVHHGLVWTAALNYLKPVMPGKVAKGSVDFRTKQMKPSLRELCHRLKSTLYPDAIVFPKVILMTEKQCRDVRDRPFKEFEGIEELQLEEVVTEGAAAFTKVVITGLHLITYENKRYIACFEFVRATLALGEMRDEDLVPIKLEKIKEQVDLFNRLFRSEAYKIPEVKNHCELLDYDADKQEYRDGDKLRLNRILVEFIDERIQDKGAEYYAKLEKTFGSNT